MKAPTKKAVWTRTSPCKVLLASFCAPTLGEVIVLDALVFTPIDMLVRGRRAGRAVKSGDVEAVVQSNALMNTTLLPGNIQGLGLRF